MEHRLEKPINTSPGVTGNLFQVQDDFADICSIADSKKWSVLRKPTRRDRNL
jgi:hypothetical protein